MASESSTKTETVSKSQIALVMGIVTTVAAGTWQIANTQIEHERDQYAGCLVELDDTTDRLVALSATCDERVEACISSGDERVEECIDKLFERRESMAEEEP